MVTLKTCPVCGSRRVRKVHDTASFTIGRRKVKVRDLDFAHCQNCREKFFDQAANQKIDAMVFGSRGRRRKAS